MRPPGPYIALSVPYRTPPLVPEGSPPRTRTYSTCRTKLIIWGMAGPISSLAKVAVTIPPNMLYDSFSFRPFTPQPPASTSEQLHGCHRAADVLLFEPPLEQVPSTALLWGNGDVRDIFLLRLCFTMISFVSSALTRKPLPIILVKDNLSGCHHVGCDTDSGAVNC